MSKNELFNEAIRLDPNCMIAYKNLAMPCPVNGIIMLNNGSQISRDNMGRLYLKRANGNVEQL